MKSKNRGKKAMRKMMLSFLFIVLCSQSATAGVCDYRPSKIIGGGSTSALAGGSGGAAATGIGMKAAGIYTLTHATTGATMLGSTATGTSAAGTIGIIAGTGNAIGSIGAMLMSPFVIIPAAIVAIGIGTYEGSCYLSEKKQP